MAINNSGGILRKYLTRVLAAGALLAIYAVSTLAVSGVFLTSTSTEVQANVGAAADAAVDTGVGADVAAAVVIGVVAYGRRRSATTRGTAGAITATEPLRIASYGRPRQRPVFFWPRGVNAN